MNYLHRFTVSAFLGLAAASAFGAAKYEEMDYGRFLTATYNNAEGKPTFDKKGCAANKGIAIKLGKEGDAAMLFDTDLLRMAGGWTGGFVKYKGVAYDGGHGPNPQPPEKAAIFFQTNPQTPGWSKGEDFNDPRQVPTGPGASKVPFGPLPKEWAKYQGLFLSGDNVVVAYSVGSANVLELPGVEKAGDQTVLTRTFNVLSQGAGSRCLLAEVDAATPVTVENGHAVVTDAKNPGGCTVIGVAGAPAGAAIEAKDGRVTLKFPALAAGQSFKVVYASGGAADVQKLAGAVRSTAPAANLAQFTKGGPAHWSEEVTVKGSLGKEEANSPYVVDTVGIPDQNPYKSWIRIGGFDFFKDGRVAFSTWNGDVWVGKGVDAKLENVTWHRYATGLFQALGLKIVNDEIYVLGRDQITHLRDLNNDGEADVYQNFNNDVQVTPGFHEFAFDLQTDPQGNFYFAKGGPVNPGGRGWGPLSEHNGCIFKISKDGQKFEVFATGIRAPNGMGVNPFNGQVTNGDNQGTWVPADYIHFVKQGDFIEVPDLAHKEVSTDKAPTHLCWIPYDMDNSCGSQTWVTSDKWGPFKGEMLYLSYGKCSLFKVLQESVDGAPQGGVVKFPLKFETGIMRARFSPLDGQLYVAGLRGWQTTAAKDAGIQRVRYTGKTVTMPTTLRVTDKGIHIGFTAPLDTNSASDAQNFSVEQYNYKWTKEYGSPDFKVSDPNAKGRDKVEVKSVRVSADRKEVFLEIPGLQPVMQMRIKMNLKDATGADFSNEIGNTINVVGKEGAATAAR